MQEVVLVKAEPSRAGGATNVTPVPDRCEDDWLPSGWIKSAQRRIDGGLDLMSFWRVPYQENVGIFLSPRPGQRGVAAPQ